MSLFKQSKILVIGDAILDKYIFGSTNRISPEAPVPIIKKNKHQIVQNIHEYIKC